MVSEFSLFIALLIIMISFVLSKVIIHFVFKRLGQIFTKKDLEMYDKLKDPTVLTIILLGFWFSTRIIGVSSILVSSTIVSLIVIIVWYILFSFIQISFTKLEKEIEKEEDEDKREDRKNTISTFKLFIQFTIALVFLLLIIKSWGQDLSNFFFSILNLIDSNKYLLSFTVFLIFLILSKTILYILKKYVNSLLKRTDRQYEYRALESVEYPVSWIIVFLGLNIALKLLGLGNTTLIPIVNTIIIVSIMHSINTIIDNLIKFWELKWHRRTNAKIDDAVFLIAHNTSKVSIVIIGFVIILTGVWNLGPEIKDVALSLSVVAVILGLALKNTITNIIGGISLMMDHSYKTKDVIKLESGEMGEVIKIGLRSTKIKTYDNEVITIPNTVLANSKIINYAQPDNILRISIPVSVEYGSNPGKVTKVLLSVLKRKRFIANHDLNDVRFTELSDYSMSFILIFFINDYKERFKIKSRVTADVYNALKKNRIKIPFPTRTIYMKHGKK